MRIPDPQGARTRRLAPGGCRPDEAEPRSDADVRIHVEAALCRSPYRAVRSVQCECSEGVVMLKGRVPSFYQKQLVQDAAMRVPVVRGVINRVDVE